MYCDIFVCYVNMFHKLLYYFKRNQFVFPPELIFFFVSIKVLPRFINSLHVKGFSSNSSSRTWVRDKYIYSHLSQGKSYGFEAWSQKKSYRNLQKVRESFSKKNFPTLLIMTSRILKSAYFTKTKKSRYLENETLFFSSNKKIH